MTPTQVRGVTALRGNGWSVTILSGPPLIAPARLLVLPRHVPGEEDALARGALWLDVRDQRHGTLLVQCALGFAGAGVAHGLWPLPEPDRLLACAGGYAYELVLDDPAKSLLLPPRPAVGVLATPEQTVLLTHHDLLVRERGGALWTTPRLSWEGVNVDAVGGELLHGRGWDMMADREVPFTVNLRTRSAEGGGYRR